MPFEPSSLRTTEEGGPHWHPLRLSSHFDKLQFATWLPFPTEDHLHEIFRCRRALLLHTPRSS